MNDSIRGSDGDVESSCQLEQKRPSHVLDHFSEGFVIVSSVKS